MEFKDNLSVPNLPDTSAFEQIIARKEKPLAHRESSKGATSSSNIILCEKSVHFQM